MKFCPVIFFIALQRSLIIITIVIIFIFNHDTHITVVLFSAFHRSPFHQRSAFFL